MQFQFGFVWRTLLLTLLLGYIFVPSPLLASTLADAILIDTSSVDDRAAERVDGAAAGADLKQTASNSSDNSATAETTDETVVQPNVLANVLEFVKAPDDCDENKTQESGEFTVGQQRFRAAYRIWSNCSSVALYRGLMVAQTVDKDDVMIIVRAELSGDDDLDGLLRKLGQQLQQPIEMGNPESEEKPEINNPGINNPEINNTASGDSTRGTPMPSEFADPASTAESGQLDNSTDATAPPQPEDSAVPTDNAAIADQGQAAPLVTATVAESLETPVNTPTESATESATEAEAVAEATATPTPTESLGTVLVQAEALNLRSGPGTSYPRRGILTEGERLVVTGQTSNCLWLKVLTPSGRTFWIAGGDEYVKLDSPCSAIERANIPPTPTPTRSSARGNNVLRSDPSKACYLIKNHLKVALTFTMTRQSGTWSTTFSIPAKSEKLKCFEPGEYTYTIDAPPPWKSTNDRLDAAAGDALRWSIGGQ